MTPPARHPDIPDPDERAALNAALFATGADTGFWDDLGRRARVRARCLPGTQSSGERLP